MRFKKEKTKINFTIHDQLFQLTIKIDYLSQVEDSQKKNQFQSIFSNQNFYLQLGIFILILIVLQRLRKQMGCQSSNQILPHEMIQNYQQYDQITLQNKYSQLIQKHQFSQAQKIGDNFYKNGKFKQAILVYQKIIEGGYTVDFDIQGLGNSDHAISRYEWWTYEWYNKQRQQGKFKGNVFDAISLCYCQIRNKQTDFLDSGILWYEDTIAARECYELYFGYANILYNRARYEQSLKYYNKLRTQKPNLINSYVSIAMLHQYRRIEKKKTVQIAKIILQKDSNNMYAQYLIARNEANVDQKINKLKIVTQKFPEYVRVVNDVGIAYGSKKDHKQAIVWYKKCAQQVPLYAAAFNNIGVRTQMLERYEQALPNYLHACELDPQYKAAHGNAIDIFDKLKYTDEQILQEMKKYPKLNEFNFYYYLGLAYYDKKRVPASIKWYKLAEQIKNDDYQLCNSFGISYDQIKDLINAEIYYKRAIVLNPKYHNPYYNLGYLYAGKKEMDTAIQWYKKAIEANPRYHKAFNNLGNIYKDRAQPLKAIEYYKKAVQVHSTYTLCLVNLAVCYLKLEMYVEAFNAFEKAKEILPTDNNNLSEGNKAFLKQNLDKFEKQGSKWRKTGSIGAEQIEILRNLIKMFQANFKQVYLGSAPHKRSDNIVLRPQILQVVRTIFEDKFQLSKIDEIVKQVKILFAYDEDYFHIIPQLFIQYFWNQFRAKKSIIGTQSELFNIIHNISSQQSRENVEGASINSNINLSMKFFNPPDSFKVNLFKNAAYFNNYEALYSEIIKVNKFAQQVLPQFTDFVDNVRKRSNGIPYGVGLKLPKRPQQQFKVILRILQKMFKVQINKTRVDSIIKKIQKKLRQNQSIINMITIVHEIMEVWTSEISLILQERSTKQIQTTCAISDLIRGKIMFKRVEDIEKAVEACDKLCHLRQYKILQLDNRLSKRQTMDVVLKIQIEEAVCELQLAMEQDQTKYHFIHAIYEIQRSPLGCIFGSYLYMSKGFNYSILPNCKDIYQRLSTKTEEIDKITSTAAKFIIDALQQKKVSE